MEAVKNLPFKIIQIETIHISSGPNNGNFAELIVLLEDGSVWMQYHSNGYANVPNDNLWYNIV